MSSLGVPAEPHSGPGEPGELLSLQGLVDLVTYHEERTSIPS
ncbi:MAG: hypothetical protein R3E96_04030 [Planctomycetota bacterium]